ncbi:MAG: efflux RND transporter periplasmic adaptor subunit [Thermoguttaceae bacterium]|nr:efflux RND transporter periplasmic adaptor subunit [Thermoguttaceae bacterium]MBR0193683.1 efflux RND transporter periplasmic adaptor subunit [Thermoguttaceae bacterium]
MESPTSARGAKRTSKRSWKKILITLLVIIGILFLLMRFIGPKLFTKADSGTMKFVTPTVAKFRHEITVRGDISSSENKDVKCQVRSTGGVMITWVVDEGTEVKEGDVIAMLDSSTLIDSRDSQVNKVAQSQAEVKAAQNNLTTSLIAKEEYENGSYKVSLQKLVSNQIQAKEERDRLAEYLQHSKILYEKGFVTKSQLEADVFSLRKAELSLRAAELDIYVLKEFTHNKQSKNHDSDIEKARANLAATTAVHQQNEYKLKDIEQQIEFCTIKSPADGKVLYVNETNRFGSSEFLVCQGAMVRERQTFLRLPNSDKLQVTADVHEGKISYIHEGQTVNVRTDATGERDIRGTVIKVDENPQPTNHWMGNVKEYRVTIALEETKGVLPGMTAETKILVEETPDDVLMVPTHTVFEHGGKYYCITKNKRGELEPLVVTLGHSNDKMVIVTSDNVKPDTPVLSAAFENRDKVTLPELQAGQTSSANIRPQVEVKEEKEKPKMMFPGAGPNGMPGQRPGGMRRNGFGPNGGGMPSDGSGFPRMRPDGGSFPEGMPRPPRDGSFPAPPGDGSGAPSFGPPSGDGSGAPSFGPPGGGRRGPRGGNFRGPGGAEGSGAPETGTAPAM